MNLYIHNIVAHIPEFFESMDFKNINTERFEGFLAITKQILNGSTNRKPSDIQPAREVFIRHHFRAVGLEFKSKYHHPLYSRISKIFREKHTIKEIRIGYTSANRVEVDALVSLIEELGHKDFVVSEEEVYFNTMEDSTNLQRGMTPDLQRLHCPIL